MMDSAERVSSRNPRDSDVLLSGREITPAHQRLECTGGDALVGVVAGGIRTQTVGIHAPWEPSRAGRGRHSSGNCRPRPGERIVFVGEPFDTQFEPEREVERDEPSRCDGLRVPPRGEGVLDGQLVGTCGFLSSLPSAVPTPT